MPTSLIESARTVSKTAVATEAGYIVSPRVLGTLSNAIQDHFRRSPDELTVETATEAIIDLAADLDALSDAEVGERFRAMWLKRQAKCDPTPTRDYERSERVREFESALGV